MHGVEKELSRGSRCLWLANKSKRITVPLVGKKELS
jgi:hypothetical protein